jgi:hypothetical protein
MIRTIVQLACAAPALALMPSFAVVAEQTFDSTTFDSPLGQPIFGSPEVVSEAERSLTPQVQRVPLNDAMDSTLSRRDNFRPSAGSPPSTTAWERRAFAAAALVALACALLGVLAALMTIARRR